MTHEEDNDGTVRVLSGETYVDGSIEQDIPVAGLAEIFNCQFFIAAQCNPHIVPFFYNSKGGVGRPSRWSSGTQEASWRGGFLLAGTHGCSYGQSLRSMASTYIFVASS
jgi:predicted acylesterase/phospholipase RssA